MEDDLIAIIFIQQKDKRRDGEREEERERKKRVYSYYCINIYEFLKCT